MSRIPIQLERHHSTRDKKKPNDVLKGECIVKRDGRSSYGDDLFGYTDDLKYHTYIYTIIIIMYPRLYFVASVEKEGN